MVARLKLKGIDGRAKIFWIGGEAKASPNRAFIVAGSRPEAEVIYPWSG